MDTPTHYELLCVTPDATADEIRNAYRRLIRLYHPDVSGVAGEAMTLRLNQAKRDLLDPMLRARYDRKRSPATAGPRVPDEWHPPVRPERTAAAPSGRHRVQDRAWMVIAVGAIVVIVAITTIVFAWSYSGPLGLTTPRVVPPLVIAVAWLVGGLSRPSKLLAGLLVIGSALWPLAALGVAPFSLLSDSVPSAILALLSLLGVSVLALRVSAPLATRPSRPHPSAA